MLGRCEPANVTCSCRIAALQTAEVDDFVATYQGSAEMKETSSAPLICNGKTAEDDTLLALDSVNFESKLVDMFAFARGPAVEYPAGCLWSSDTAASPYPSSTGGTGRYATPGCNLVTNPGGPLACVLMEMWTQLHFCSNTWCHLHGEDLLHCKAPNFQKSVSLVCCFLSAMELCIQ